MLSVLVLCACAAPVVAQPRPLAGTTLVTTDTGVTSVCVGANTINAPSTCLGGLQAGATVVNQAITLPSFTPSVTTNKLYQSGGTLFFSGSAIAVGGAVGPGTLNAIARFTGANSVGDSLLTQSGTVLTAAATFVSNVFGASSFTAGAAGDESLTVRNTSAGVANRGVLFLGNDASATLGTLAAHSSTFTTSGAAIANGVKLTASGVGGLSLQASDATGIVHFFTGTGTVERGQITAAGLWNWSTFGAHLFTAGAVGNNSLTVKNTTAGTGNSAQITAASDTVNASLTALSSTYTTSGAFVQAGSTVFGDGSGGLSLAATHASGAVRIYTGSGTLRATVFADGAIGINGGTDQGAAGIINLVGALWIDGSAVTPPLSINAADLGGANNRYLFIGRNTNGAGVAGALGLQNVGGGSTNYVWVDAGGLVRVSTSGPASGDTTGTIVGTQSSTRDSKDLRGQTLTPTAALAQLLQTPVHEFTYRNGSYNGSVFQGIVADEAPMLMMDAGRSFSPITAFGYTVQAIKALQAQIDALQVR